MTELTRFLDTAGIIQKENCILLRKKKHNPQQAETIQQGGTGEPVVSVHLRAQSANSKLEIWMLNPPDIVLPRRKQ